MRQPSDKLYVIGNPGVQTVKIGITNNVDRRLGEISAGVCPYRIDRGRLAALRVYEFRNAHSLELALHARFAPLRLLRFNEVRHGKLPAQGRTEWFRFGAGALFLIDGAVAQFMRGERI